MGSVWGPFVSSSMMPNRPTRIIAKWLLEEVNKLNLKTRKRTVKSNRKFVDRLASFDVKDCFHYSKSDLRGRKMVFTSMSEF